MPTNPTYFNSIIHFRDDHEEYSVLCNGHVGDAQNTDSEKVNCHKCKKFMADSSALSISRKLRKERAEKETRKAKGL